MASLSIPIMGDTNSYHYLRFATWVVEDGERSMEWYCACKHFNDQLSKSRECDIFKVRNSLNGLDPWVNIYRG
jgi:hypothetical protein